MHAPSIEQAVKEIQVAFATALLYLKLVLNEKTISSLMILAFPHLIVKPSKEYTGICTDDKLFFMYILLIAKQIDFYFRNIDFNAKKSSHYAPWSLNNLQKDLKLDLFLSTDKFKDRIFVYHAVCFILIFCMCVYVILYGCYLDQGSIVKDIVILM